MVPLRFTENNVYIRKKEKNLSTAAGMLPKVARMGGSSSGSQLPRAGLGSVDPISWLGMDLSPFPAGSPSPGVWGRSRLNFRLE